MDTWNGFVYSFGAAILDLETTLEGALLRYRSSQHILTPEADYEVYGHVSNVVFLCATILDELTHRIAIYYGAAGTFCCLANARLSELVSFVKENSCVFKAWPA